MSKFLYKAKKGPTEIVQGEIDAEDEESALGKIGAMGLIPMRLLPAGGVSADKTRTNAGAGVPRPSKGAGTASPRTGAAVAVDKKKVRICTELDLIFALVDLLTNKKKDTSTVFIGRV